MDITALWKPEYSVGHQDMDEQHKYLFELWILLDSVKVQPESSRSLEQALLSLFGYAEIHFAQEEAYLRTHPEIENHRKIHRDFIDQAKSFMTQFENNALAAHTVVDYLRNWLIDHIVGTDIRYFKELEK